jgi:hypothetical protein
MSAITLGSATTCDCLGLLQTGTITDLHALHGRARPT